MKNKNIFLKTFAVILFLILLTTFYTACSKNTDEQTNDYPVVGIWHAQYSWHEQNPYNYGGDNYELNIYFDFRKDGTLKSKNTLSLNGRLFSDDFSDWVILNLTWEVSNNIITLSSGKKYVIIDDEFNDTYPNPNVILHFKKVQGE